MNKMSQLDNIVSAYKTLSKIPSVVGGKLINNGSKISSHWSVRNLDKGKNTKFLYNYVLNDSFNVIAESEFGIDISNELLSSVSPQETFKAVIREEKNGKDTKKQYLEVWKKNSLVHSIDLTALDIHGDVYADGEFGCLNWSQDESAIVYVAEKKLPKTESYVKRKAEDKPKMNGSGETPPTKGEEFLYRQDWGEQLVGKYLSVIVVCKLQTETCTILEGLPETWCPGQVRFCPDGRGVAGVAWRTEPRRLGLIFCTNRPSCIFTLTLDGHLKKMSSEGMAVRSPRFSPSGHLLWLRRAPGGPHHACHELVMLRNGQTEPTTVIDIVEDELKIVGGDSFYGVYCSGLPANCFSADSRRLVISTPQQNEVRSYVVDLDGGRIVDISNKSFPCSTTILDIKSDIILASCSNLTTPSQLYVARLPAAGNEAAIRWVSVGSPTHVPAAIQTGRVNYLQLAHTASTDAVKSFSAILLMPKVEGKAPLVVWPHGGPHSGFVNSFSIEAALFAMLGLASLRINYRGSIGRGETNVRCLLGHAGSYDVDDCLLALTIAIERDGDIDRDNLVLYGGSYGGFLTAHLAGMRPEMFKVMVLRNPLIDLATMGHYADCLDGINYRGSIGRGETNVRCLLGHAGSYDVEDCLLALTTAIEQDGDIDRDNLVLYGGSYGGFITAHLAGMRPEMFKAMVQRNPLIDLATKGHYADNSDGCAVEAGFEFTEKGPVSEDELLAMRRCSPLAHVHRVRAPTCLMLGSGDKRVPMFQGLEYARRLKANGVDTRIYMYDDNHSLSSLPAETDNLINGASWILEHLQS